MLQATTYFTYRPHRECFSPLQVLLPPLWAPEVAAAAPVVEERWSAQACHHKDHLINIFLVLGWHAFRTTNFEESTALWPLAVAVESLIKHLWFGMNSAGQQSARTVGFATEHVFHTDLLHSTILGDLCFSSSEKINLKDLLFLYHNRLKIAFPAIRLPDLLGLQTFLTFTNQLLSNEQWMLHTHTKDIYIFPPRTQYKKETMFHSRCLHQAQARGCHLLPSRHLLNSQGRVLWQAWGWDLLRPPPHLLNPPHLLSLVSSFGKVLAPFLQLL